MRTLPFVLLMALTSTSVVETQAKLDLLTHFSAHAAERDVIDVSKIANSVRISLGQKNVIAFDQRGDRLVNPRRVQGAQKRPAVTLKFFADDTTKGLIILQIENSYPRIIRYRAAVRLRGSRDFHETNTLPLNPNVPVLEGWKGPFDELVLFDFHLTNETPPKTA
jgi:hypothetical protein